MCHRKQESLLTLRQFIQSVTLHCVMEFDRRNYIALSEKTPTKWRDRYPLCATNAAGAPNVVADTMSPLRASVSVAAISPISLSSLRNV